MSQEVFKDAVLDRVASSGNVAQFVSFGPELEQRYSRIRGHKPNDRFDSVDVAVEALLNAAPDQSVNVRSYDPAQPKGQEFAYGLRDPSAVITRLRSFSDTGLFTIVNETIDVGDGGVSGVLVGDVAEFAPGDTPRCVEKPGIASLPRDLALKLLTVVYGFRPQLDYDASLRVEFSLHPLRRGYRNTHTIIWEIEEAESLDLSARVTWPNRFSQFLGDKAYGLLVGECIGLPIPQTTVVSRGVHPFRFGAATRTDEVWIRTCPVRQIPGLFTTQRGWRDPFRLLAEEDPTGTQIASVLAQEGVEALYSGALMMTEDGPTVIEGVRGWGDRFMLGEAPPEELPSAVRSAVEQLSAKASLRLGPVRLEWVHDGRDAWVVQLHAGASASGWDIIVSGEARSFRQFEVHQGLEALRALVAEMLGGPDGIELVGNIGITSHFGDILRTARIPSRLKRPTGSPPDVG